METYDVTLTRWHKMGHSVYAANENLYDHYWVKGFDVSVPSNWLKTAIQELGFDSICCFLNETEYNKDRHELVNHIIDKADNDNVSCKPFLYYMRNKTVDSVSYCSTADLLHDAYICRELYFDETSDKQKELLEKYPDEANALINIYPSVDRELLSRFSDSIDVNKEIPYSYCYIEFLRFCSPDKMGRIRIFDLYNQLYKLYCFFDSVKEPLKKKAANEYKHCKVMKEAFELELFKRLRFASDVGLI